MSLGNLRGGCHRRRRRTRFVELFRTTPANTVCPNFYVLRHAGGCGFRPQCSYCYLKSSFWYLARPQVFTNTAALLGDVRRWIRSDGLETYLLNMGNLSDSLVFEAVRPILPPLVELFRAEAEKHGRPHCLLLVTKGGVRESAPLLQLRPCRNVIISFSVNHPAAARCHEAGAPPPADRLRAARRLQTAGWRVRIRLDPMLAGFNYTRLAEQIRRLDPERITLGTLRAEQALPRFAPNGLFAALARPRRHRALARYPLRQRLALYRQAVRALGRRRPLGLCEETPAVWRALGLDPGRPTCNCGVAP